MGKTRYRFKKIRDTKGTFHAKMGSIKDRNGMDLTEAEETRLKRLSSSSSNLHKVEQQEKPEYQLRNARIDSKTVRKNKQIVITKIRLMILRKRMEL